MMIQNPLMERFDRKVLFLLLFFIAFIICGGNDYNPDYKEYEYRYLQLVQDVHTGFLLYHVQVFFNSLGCSYQLFRIVESFFALILLAKSIRCFTKNDSVVLVLYLVYPFLLDIVQMGNFIAYSIVLYSLKYLEEKFFYGGLKYTIAVMIASQFHILAISYILFLLVYLKNKKLLVMISIGITCFFTLMINVLPRYIYRLPIIGSHYGQIRYYLTYNESYKNGAVTYALLLFVCFLIYYIKVIQTNKSGFAYSSGVLSEKFFGIFSLMLCFVPFILINAEFVRLVRNMWILYYIAFWVDSKDYNGIPLKMDNYFKIFAVLLAVFLFYKELSPTAYYYDSVTCTIFQNNDFFEKISFY